MLEKDTSVITYSRVCAIHHATVNQLPVKHLYVTLTRDTDKLGLMLLKSLCSSVRAMSNARNLY